MSTNASTPTPFHGSDDAADKDFPSSSEIGDAGFGGEVSRMEWLLAGVAAVALVTLHWFYARSYLWNSDEAQHLHVVWAWATGLLPYRDIFDNHAPLFHVLSVPLFRLLGERPDIVVPMRVAMQPLFGASLWCIYRIGAQVFSPRVGLWSALLLGFYPKFFFLMGEYRTDVLWTVLWLGSLVVLTGGPLTRRRLFCAGLLVGTAFGVSLKTILLVLTMMTAGAVTWVAWRCLAPREPATPRTWVNTLSLGSTALAGVVLVPFLILIFFAAQDSLRPLYYCLIQHNILPHQAISARDLRHPFSWESMSILPALALGMTTLPLFASHPRRAARRLFLILSAGFFCPLLNGLWRSVTGQDYLPWYPLAALAVAASLLVLTGRLRAGWLGPKVGLALPLVLLLVAGEVHWMLRHPVFGRGSTDRIAAIAEALQLTKAGEYVMDPKGDLIFHPRPYYYVLETLTKRRLRHGLLKDELPKRLIETRTAVIQPAYSRMTPGSIAFVRENYLPAGYLDVLGKMLPVPPGGVVLFDVTIPERYLIMAKEGMVTGTLDGKPLEGPLWLSAGPHELRLTSPVSEVALFWARAREKGYSPFDPPPPGHIEGDS